jgi:hypothetical protein
MYTVDDGWVLEPENPLKKLIREALILLEGEAPDDISLSGEGWSLENPAPAPAAEPSKPTLELAPELVAEPEPVPEPALELAPVAEPVAEPQPEPSPSASDSFRDLMHAALDEAFADGWALADDSEAEDLSDEEEAFFAAGEAMADAMTTIECEVGTYREEPSFWQRLWRRSA